MLFATCHESCRLNRASRKKRRPEAASLLTRVQEASPKFGLDEDNTQTYEFLTGNFMVGIDEHPLPFTIYEDYQPDK